MIKTLVATSALIALATPAFAFNFGAAPSQPALIENVRADCVWVDNKWTYKRGDKRLVCRPDRPRGAGWAWFRDGGREGWHHRGRKEWNHKNW